MDYGPSSSFWLFAFERMNGILGSVSTNHQAIEVQLMRKFISNQQVLHKLASDSDLKKLLQAHQQIKGSLKHEVIPDLPLSLPLSLSTCKDYSEICELLPPISERCLTVGEKTNINILMRSLFGEACVRTLMLHIVFSPFTISRSSIWLLQLSRTVIINGVY